MVFIKVIAMIVVLFPIQNLFAQEIDKSLYQKTTGAEVDWDPEVTKYYKFDAVFVDREPHKNAGEGNDFFGVFKLNGEEKYDDARGSYPGPNTLPQIKPGQFVTIYFHISPGRTPQGLRKYLIDHIEIPAEDFSFVATHKTSKETKIWFPVSEGVLLTIDSGVEVQVLGPESYDRKMEEGDGIWVWLVTSDGFGGWVYSPNLGPLQPTAAEESPPPVVVEESQVRAPAIKTSLPTVVTKPEPAVTPEAERSSGFPLPWAIAGLCAVLLAVIIVIIAAKRKKRGN